MRPRTGSKVARFAGAVAALTALAIGVPGVLLAVARRRFGGVAPWHGVPPPSAWESDAVRRALTEPLTDDTIADVVIRISLAVAWSAVIVLVVAVAAECGHMLRYEGFPTPDVRGLGLVQSAARTIAAGLLVVVPTVTPTSALARDLTGPPPGPVPAAAPQPDPSAPTDHDVDPGLDEGDGRDERPDPTVGTGGGGRYVVRAGDSIHGIAERIAGPDRDRVADYADRLLESNLGRRMPDGRRFEHPALVDVGWVLELPALGPPPGSTAPVGSAASDVHVVERGETLWSIAEDELGDPRRWPEIYEANRGRAFDDGRRLEEPSLILPGWGLDLPAAADPAVDPTVDPTADVVGSRAPSGSPEATTVAGDAETELGPTEEADAAPVAPADPEPVGDRAATPSDGADGQRAGPPWSPGTDAGGDGADPRSGPGRPSTAAGAERAAPRPTNRWTNVPAAEPGDLTAPVARPSPAPGGEPAQPSDRVAPPLLTLGQAAMLSAGVVALLTVRRRRRLRRSSSHVTPPGPRAVAVERSIRSVPGGDRLHRVDRAVRAAAPALVAGRERVVAVLVARDGRIELLASGPADLAPPWEPGPDPTRWLLPPAAPVEPPAGARTGAPCTTLVQLGRAVDGHDVYVDLEALEAIEVGGPGDRADAIVTAVAATLAASPLAETACLVAVGIDDAAFLAHRHHVAARDPSEAFRRAREATGPTPIGGSTFELRTRATGGEAWEPAVVLVGASAGTVTPPSDRAALAVVSASPIHGPSSRLEPDGDAWSLRPLGIRLVPVGLDTAELVAVASLVGTAEDDRLDASSVDGACPATSVGDGIEPVVDLSAVPPTRVEPVDDRTLAPRPEVPAGTVPDDDRGARLPSAPPLLVRLLGPVGVESADGHPARFERSKATELVAWLATHRDRPTRTGARTALWELDVRDATFANVVSEARRTLARLVEPPPGEEWIGRTLTEALPLHPHVRTDADLLRDALAAARVLTAEPAIATLRPAVELIVGMPFEGTSYLWPEAEGIASELVVLATSAATELATHHLAAGDIDGVFEATGRGLRVLPGHEGLVALRMRAHARSGDHAGVRHEWEQYERVVTADPWSDGEPASALLELRRRLLAR